ncbi:alpha/beta fold hydrolase [Deinococcus frigens]|uniref:alpha/beta fold hydrolase n=1 Tax=Deinococcus frigens TaxID=249403 RepID=UPI00055295E3|nr:alpha/beta hydrolase [Deinococcus frigens]
MFIPAADGIPLHLTRLNAGPPLLLLSGGPGYDPYLKPVAKLLPDVEGLLLAARGTGQSGGGAHGLDAAIADLETVREALGLEQWGVLGHSWGAALGLAYALAHPERVSHLISFAGTGIQHDQDWKAAYEASKDAELPLDIPYSPEVHRALLADWRRWIKLPDLLLHLLRLPVKTTFLHSGADIRPGWPAAQLASLLPAAEWRELPGAPHHAWLTHAPELEQALRGILTF